MERIGCLKTSGWLGGAVGVDLLGLESQEARKRRRSTSGSFHPAGAVVDLPSAGLAGEDPCVHQALEFALDRALAGPNLAGDLPEIERLVRVDASPSSLPFLTARCYLLAVFCRSPIASAGAEWYKRAILHSSNTLWHRRLVGR